ncbi:MAG: DNA gyrase subunit A [Zetaproteobacteria bacterium]|nr:DNA gyrase subunit A [Zetaproteobacteria bacterium]
MSELSGSVLNISIENEMKTSFLDYSMSVIVSRALPDVRDGLKPVHRRILYAMHGLKNYHNKPYLKSARIVGDVIGKYHPHGDSAVYDALVRMAQDFSLRYTMVDGQGNFGSLDGDAAAAMRYTESRMEAFSEALLEDLEKDTVDFVPNYDNKDEEPSVLPARIPQLMVNGASGIAVGMATNIPPHNLAEVAYALKALIADPSIDVAGLMQHVKGPDFPTRAEIHGRKGIQEAYETGRGSVVMRACAEVEPMPKNSGRERIVITEIPYQVNKARLIEKIADLVRSKRIEGISDLRDESAKEDIRIVIDLKTGEAGQILLNQLYKLTPLQTSFGVNMVALVDGRPRLLNLKEVLQEFYYHRRNVILRRTAYLLRKAQERAHILAGLKAAVEEADRVIELIRAAPSTAEASEVLQQEFALSAIQVKAILDMRLARLTGMEREKIVEEYQQVSEQIIDYKDILAKPDRVTKILLTELDEVVDKFGDERRTKILASDAESFSMESLVADEEVSVTVTRAGYVKRTPLDQISAQKRGGKGKAGVLMKEEDLVMDIFTTSNHQALLCFTNLGKVFTLRVYEVPEAGLRTRGKHFANMLKLESGEKVVSVLSVGNTETKGYVFSVTKAGYIKKTDLEAYCKVRATGIIGLKLDSGDELVCCKVAREQGDDVLLATAQGKVIRFAAEDVRHMGRAARGVTGIRFDEEDSVIGMEVVPSEQSTKEEATLLSVCENGFGKRTPLSEYRRQTRGGKGVYTIKVSQRNGAVVAILLVKGRDDIVAATSAGKITRFHAEDIRVIGRHTQGVRLMSIQPGESVIGMNRVLNSEEEK